MKKEVEIIKDIKKNNFKEFLKENHHDIYKLNNC